MYFFQVLWLWCLVIENQELVKLEFNPINKFSSSFENYPQIGMDFFDTADHELCLTLGCDKSFKDSLHYLKQINSKFIKNT